MQSNTINEKELKNFFRLYNIKKIINSGELYMFNAKLTKNEHDKIKQEFEKIVNEQSNKIDNELEQKQNKHNFCNNNLDYKQQNLSENFKEALHSNFSENTTENLNEDLNKNFQNNPSENNQNILATRPEYIKTLTDLN